MLGNLQKRPSDSLVVTDADEKAGRSTAVTL